MENNDLTASIKFSHAHAALSQFGLIPPDNFSSDDPVFLQTFLIPRTKLVLFVVRTSIKLLGYALLLKISSLTHNDYN